MSQVDLLNYWPLLSWFIFIFILPYFLIFCYLVPLIFQSLKVQQLFLENQILFVINYNRLIIYFKLVLKTNKFPKFINLLIRNLKLNFYINCIKLKKIYV